jgi:hypothetical protein
MIRMCYRSRIWAGRDAINYLGESSFYAIPKVADNSRALKWKRDRSSSNYTPTCSNPTRSSVPGTPTSLGRPAPPARTTSSQGGPSAARCVETCLCGQNQSSRAHNTRGEGVHCVLKASKKCLPAGFKERCRRALRMQIHSQSPVGHLRPPSCR